VILFGDIDHIEKESTLIITKKALGSYFSINENDFSYTLSKKEYEYSYHWSFNGYYTTVENLKKNI